MPCLINDSIPEAQSTQLSHLVSIKAQGYLILLLELGKLLMLLNNPLLDVQLHLLLACTLRLSPGSCCSSFLALRCSLPLRLCHYALHTNAWNQSRGCAFWQLLMQLPCFSLQLPLLCLLGCPSYKYILAAVPQQAQPTLHLGSASFSRQHQSAEAH